MKYQPLPLLSPHAINLLVGANVSQSIYFTIGECKELHDKGVKVIDTETEALHMD